MPSKTRKTKRRRRRKGRRSGRFTSVLVVMGLLFLAVAAFGGTIIATNALDLQHPVATIEGGR
jgi:hypothetical protein